MLNSRSFRLMQLIRDAAKSYKINIFRANLQN